MSYFNHAFQKVFIGTHPTQAASAGVAAGVDSGFLTSAGIATVNLIQTAAPYALGLGVYGLFSPKTYLSVNGASLEVTTGAPLILASTALYCKDKVGQFHGGYQESTKSKMINPKYVNRFYRVDPCTANPHIIHVGNTPFTATSGIAASSVTTAGTGYNATATITGVTFTGGSGTGAVATITTSGAGAITSIVITSPGTGYQVTDILVPMVGSGSPALTFTPGTAAAITITVLTPVDPTCCKEFLCDESYTLRIDVKGSPELRYLSRNGYWSTSTYTGCCPADCGTPVPVDSTLVFIEWAKELLDNRIVGPFMNIVVYDETGIAWTSPGPANILGDNGGINISPGVGSITITSGGSGYVEGVYCNVSFQGCANGSGMLATVTVDEDGVITTIAITNPGSGYGIGSVLGSPQIPTTAGSLCESVSFIVTTLITPTWDNYVSPGHVAGKCAGMKITGAYVDTQFGDCTFYPSDFFEKEPVKIYASLVDETGDVCEFTSLCVITECEPRQGMGFGDTVLKELILSESYMQNYFYTGLDLRIREITQGYDVSSAIIRSALYFRYYILHSVPRFNNPSGTFDNDQYLLEVITTAPSPTFESTVGAWLTACNCSAELELVSCGPCCTGTVCPVITLAPPILVGTVTTGTYSSTIVASGGNAPYTYAVTSGILPIGLTLTSAGVLAGTLTTVGSYTFTVTAADQDGCNGTGTFTIVVTA